MPRGSTQIFNPYLSKQVCERRAPRPIDLHIGSQIQLGRALAGISQEVLGQSLGLTVRRIQNFELGTNRVSATWLFQLAGALDVPVSFFFGDGPTASNSILH